MSTYEFDPLGTNPANLVTNEQVPITQVNDPPVSVVVPAAAPFFKRDCVLRYRAPGSVGQGTLMFEGVDFYFGWKFVAATRTIGEPIYGCIILTNPTLNGSVYFEQYRTLGGDWVQTQQAIFDMLSSVLYHPRITTWDEVTPQLVAFPVINHPHNISDLRGMEDVINAISEIPAAILSAASQGLSNHLAAVNPHNITKFTIDLGNVPNYPIASAAQAALGESDEVLMSALKTRILLEEMLGDVGLGGIIGGPGGGGPVDGADVQGPDGGVLNNEVVLFDGVGGKFIKGTAGTLTYFTVGDKRGAQVSGASGVRATLRLSGPNGRVDLILGDTVVGNQDILMPNGSGTLVLASSLYVPNGRVPFRTTGASGTTGLPDSSLQASEGVVNNALVIRQGNGQITVPGLPAGDNDAVGRKFVQDNFISVNSSLFLRSDQLLTSGDTPVAQRTYGAVAIMEILSNYTTTISVAQAFADLDVDSLVRTDTTLFIRSEDLVDENAVPSVEEVYSTAAVQEILTDYATRAWVQQLVEDIDPGTGPVQPSTLTISVAEDTLTNPINLVDNTFHIFPVTSDGAVMNLPQDSADKTRIAIAVLDRLGNHPFTVASDTVAMYGTVNNNSVVRQSNVVLVYQMDATVGWVRLSIGDFYPEDKKPSGSTWRTEASITLNGALPDTANYSIGTVLEIEVTESIGTYEYPAGSFLVRNSTGWIHLGGVDTTALEETLDILIDGFTTLTAALQ